MLGVLPILASLAAAMAVFAGGRPRPCREAAAVAATLWALWLVLGTEFLSRFSAMRPDPLAIWWVVPMPALITIAIYGWRRTPTPPALCDMPPPRPDWLTAVLLAATVLILLATGAISAVTPSNNWDAQNYHLPRQVHWMQQASVSHFATPDLRMVMMPPMAEFVGLHFMILSGGDAWAGLIQWFALALTAGTVSLIARELGAGSRGQALAALLVVTYPIAALQATDAKNDIVMSLWACAMAYFVLQVWTRRSCPPCRAALIGATLGLMVLTKGTGLIVGLPISLAAAVAILRVQRWRGLVTGAAIGAIALAINSGHFARNTQEFGSPTGPSVAEGGYPLANEAHSPAAIGSNIIRNITLHIGTPSDDVNAGIQSASERLHTALGIAPDDPRTTYLGMPYQVVHRPWSESESPAPLHLVLALLVIPVLLALRRRWLLVVCALVGYTALLLFCIMLKWQPWHGRLHMPMVFLLAPVAAVLLEGAWRSAAVAGIGALAVVTPSLLWNHAKPLIASPSVFTAHRDENTFRARSRLLAPFREAIEAACQLEPAPTTVAILRVNDQWTYAFQAALLRDLPSPPRFITISKHRAQRRDYQFEPPDLILHTDGRAFWLGAHGTRYFPAAHAGQYTLYIPRDRALARGLPPRPPFIGWHNVEGLGAPEGPFPARNLPEVRWGLGPATTFRTYSDGEPTTLVFEARGHPGVTPTVTLRLNGELVATTPAITDGEDFQEFRLRLAPQRGLNELTIEYSDWHTTGPRPLAIVYRRLQILPDEYLDDAPAP